MEFFVTNDEVLDRIKYLPQDHKRILFKSLNEGKGSNIVAVFKLKGIVYLLIKFGKVDDSGLLLVTTEDVFELFEFVDKRGPEYLPEPELQQLKARIVNLIAS